MALLDILFGRKEERATPPALPGTSAPATAIARAPTTLFDPKAGAGSSILSTPVAKGTAAPAPAIPGTAPLFAKAKQDVAKFREAETFSLDKAPLRSLVDRQTLDEGSADEIAETLIRNGRKIAAREYFSKKSTKTIPGMTASFISQAGEGAISGGLDLFGRAAEGLGAKDNPLLRTTGQQQLGIYRKFLEKHAPDRLIDFEDAIAQEGYMGGAEVTGRALEGIVESAAVGSAVYRATATIPAMQKLAQGGRWSRYLHTAVQNLSADIGIRTEMALKNKQQASEIARGVASSPSILFAFSSVPLLGMGVAADVLAGKLNGLSTGDAIINAATNLGGNMVDYRGMQKLSDIPIEDVKSKFMESFSGPKELANAIWKEQELVYNYARANPEDVRGVQKFTIEGEKRLLKLKGDLEKQSMSGEKRLINKTGPAKPVPGVPEDNLPPNTFTPRGKAETAPEIPGAPTRKSLQDDILKLEEEISMRKELIGSKADMVSFQNKKTGELPEVTGLGKSEFARTGDSIAKTQGFEDSEALRSEHMTTQSQKAKVKSLKLELKEKKAQLDLLPKPKERQKGFVETVKTSPATSKELKKAVREIDPQTYEVAPNKSALDYAEGVLEADGPDGLRQLIGPDMPVSAEKTAAGMRLSQYYEDLALKATDDATRNRNLDLAREVISTVDEQAREAGRSTQIIVQWHKRSPAYITRMIEKNIENELTNAGKKALEGDVLTTPQKRELQMLANRINKAQSPQERQDIYTQMIDVIGRTVKPKFKDYYDAFRYQNILSNPQSQERNAIGNLMQIFIMRPATLGWQSVTDTAVSMIPGRNREAYAKNVPEYYKRVFEAMPEAVQAFKDSWRLGKLWNTDIDPTSTEFVRFAKQKQLPKLLTIPQRALEAMDRFGTTLISAGEYGRLVQNGMDPGQAKVAAAKVAETWLYRNKLDSKNVDNSYISRILDGAGEMVLSGRHKPIIGPVISAVNPFITTPINVIKMSTDFSPLGIIGGAKSNEQIAKASLGSMITAVGGLLAAQGYTTANAPAGRKQRDVFYNSGKKPWSVKIGNAWVPMWYFGPLAFALAIPASFADRARNGQDTNPEKAGKIALDLTRFIGSQTALKGMDNFMGLLSGDIDYTIGSSLGFTASQFVPLAGFNRWINKVTDDVYRKQSGFMDPIYGALPGGNKMLEPYSTPRDKLNAFIPYDIGFEKKKGKSSLPGMPEMDDLPELPGLEDLPELPPLPPLP